MPNKLILALPAYNEAENLRPLVSEAADVLGKAGIDYQILIVDDGSSDGTADAARELSAQYPVTLIQHEHNKGLGAAIRTLIEESLGRLSGDDDVVVNMDADNTHDPSYIPAMAAKVWNEGYDVVIASRFRSGSREVGVPLFRRVLSRGARLLFRMFLRLPEVRDYTCGYRAYRVGALRSAKERYGDRIITREGFACTDELLVHISRVTQRITEVPFVLRYDKKRGHSKLPFVRTVLETLKMLMSRE